MTAAQAIDYQFGFKVSETWFYKTIAEKLPLLILALAAVFVAALQAQVLRTVPYNLVRLDPALDALIDPASPLEILGEHFGLTEGPVWVKDASGGYLLFSEDKGTGFSLKKQ